MSTQYNNENQAIKTIQINNVVPPPIFVQPPQKQTLMSDDDIDKLIEAQRAIHQQPKEISQQIPHINQEPTTQSSSIGLGDSSNSNDTPSDDKQTELSFDFIGMNNNLGAIINSTKTRIKSLQDQQDKISSRIGLLEKFIKLDEKELAIEVSKPEPNVQKIKGLRNAISNQTELFSNTMDILLKFESSIYTWTKALMDIEKDKVSAYQKVKSVNKEQSTTESDINDVLLNLNNVIRNNPDKVLGSANNFLNISGYGGKKFNS